MNIDELFSSENAYCTESSGFHRYSDCPDLVTRSRQFQKAEKRMERLIDQIVKYSTKQGVMRSKRHSSKLVKILNRAKCMRDKLREGIHLVCNAKTIPCALSKALAHTLPFLSSKKNTIFLCPNLFDFKSNSFARNPNLMTKLIIHETGHLCGTSVIERYDHYLGLLLYFEGEEITDPAKLKERLLSIRGRSRRHKASNSDSYCYWAFAGFCLPGFDCKQNIEEPPTAP